MHQIEKNIKQLIFRSEEVNHAYLIIFYNLKLLLLIYYEIHTHLLIDGNLIHGLNGLGAPVELLYLKSTSSYISAATIGT